MVGTLTNLLFVEIAVTAIAIAMLVWRSFMDMKEDDHLVLDDAEAHHLRVGEQAVEVRSVAGVGSGRGAAVERGGGGVE